MRPLYEKNGNGEHDRKAPDLGQKITMAINKRPLMWKRHSFIPNVKCVKPGTLNVFDTRGEKSEMSERNECVREGKMGE